RLAMTSSLSWPRLRMRWSSAAREGGRMNTPTASGTTWRTWRAPCQSISSSTSRPAASCGSTDWRAVPFQSPCTRAYSKKSPASIMRRNSASSTQWWCSAWRSPGRGGREVNDTDRQMFRSRARHAFTMLDFPAPDGAATMKRLPRIGASPLFNVLYLFADLVDQDLQLHRRLRGAAVDGLRAQRVRFAVEFLQQEVQAAADGLLLPEDVPD